MSIQKLNIEGNMYMYEALNKYLIAYTGCKGTAITFTGDKLNPNKQKSIT